MDILKGDNNYFKIIKIDRQKNVVTVEDTDLGLVFEIYGQDKGWELVEMYNNYSIKFVYKTRPDVIIDFME